MEKRTKEQDIQEMMMGPSSNNQDNSTFVLKDKDKDDNHEKIDPVFDGKIKNEKISNKYKEAILKEAEKNPNSIMIDTPDGRMTIKQAIEKGYDPKTGKFIRKQLEKPNFDKKFEGKGFSPDQKSKFKQFTDPRSFNMKPDEKKRMGFKDNKFNKKYGDDVQAPRQQSQPNKLEALLGGRSGGGFNGNN